MHFLWGLAPPTGKSFAPPKGVQQLQSTLNAFFWPRVLPLEEGSSQCTVDNVCKSSRTLCTLLLLGTGALFCVIFELSIEDYFNTQPQLPTLT
mmetsp:Transcript_27533/g.45545  ORF Transcript_27533/g.45545 Transcript_27533/m.45545 type:complete len:93 (-) Transcript_27533:440-718(-)